MNYADIKQYDVANGPGIRVSLFVSGCTHRCKNCFNPETWDFAYGQPFTRQEEDLILDYMKPDYVSGLTLLGGDPFEPANQEALVPLLKRVRETFPQKKTWCFTGFLYEDILNDMMNTLPFTRELLSYIDVLVDGPFIEEQKNLSLRFKGSENQRTILVPESLTAKQVILWNPENDT